MPDYQSPRQRLEDVFYLYTAPTVNRKYPTLDISKLSDSELAYLNNTGNLPDSVSLPAVSLPAASRSTTTTAQRSEGERTDLSYEDFARRYGEIALGTPAEGVGAFRDRVMGETGIDPSTYDAFANRFTNEFRAYRSRLRDPSQFNIDQFIQHITGDDGGRGGGGDTGGGGGGGDRGGGGGGGTTGGGGGYGGSIGDDTRAGGRTGTTIPPFTSTSTGVSPEDLGAFTELLGQLGQLFGQGQGTPGKTGFGDINLGSLNALLPFTSERLGNALPGALNPSPEVSRNLAGLYGTIRPEQLITQILGGAGGTGIGPVNTGVFPGLGRNLDYLNAYGLPGAQQLEGERARLGAAGEAERGTVASILNQIITGGLPGQEQVQAEQDLLGGWGTGAIGRVGDLLNQVLLRGIPGQGDIEGLIGSQTSLGPYLQARAGEQLLQNEPRLAPAAAGVVNYPIRTEAPRLVETPAAGPTPAARLLGQYGQRLLGTGYATPAPPALAGAEQYARRLGDTAAATPQVTAPPSVAPPLAQTPMLAPPPSVAAPSLPAPPRAERPEFFAQLLGRAFGAGGNLRTPTVTAGTIPSPATLGEYANLARTPTSGVRIPGPASAAEYAQLARRPAPGVTIPSPATLGEYANLARTPTPGVRIPSPATLGEYAQVARTPTPNVNIPSPATLGEYSQLARTPAAGAPTLQGLIERYARSTLETGLPEGFADSYTRRIYEPARERLLGDLNRRGVLDSGERLRQERELFNQTYGDTLAMTDLARREAAARLAMEQGGEEIRRLFGNRQLSANILGDVVGREAALGPAQAELTQRNQLANRELTANILGDVVGRETGLGATQAELDLRNLLANRQTAAGVLGDVVGREAALGPAQAELGLRSELAQRGLSANVLGDLVGREAGLGTTQAEFDLRNLLANRQTAAGVLGDVVGREAALGPAQAGLNLEAARSNQAAELGTQQLGVDAALRGLGILPGLAQQDIERQFGNIQNLIGTRQFGAGQDLQAQLANQAAAQRFGETGFEGGLRTNFANQAAIQAAQEASQERGMRASLANLDAALRAAGLTTGNLQGAAGLLGDIGRTQAGLPLQAAELGLRSAGLGGGFLGQEAGIEAGVAQQAPELAIRAALANQGALQRAGEFGTETRLRQAGTAQDILNQLFGQGIQRAGSLANIGTGALGTGLEAFRAVPSATLPFYQLGGDIGQNLLGQSLARFRAVPEAAYPFVNLAASTGEGALDRALQRFTAGSTTGLENLRTIGSLGSLPITLGLQQEQAQQGRTDQVQRLLSGLLGGAQNYLGQNLEFGARIAQQPVDLLRSLVGGVSDQARAELAAQAAREQAIGGGLGSTVGALLPLILGGGGGGGRGGGSSIISKIGGLFRRIFSSEKLKDDIEPMGNRREALDRVLAIPLATWRYKPEIDPSRKKRLGWINETVDPIFTDDGGLTVDPITVIGHLVASVQEQQKDIGRLRKRLHHA